MCLHVFVHICGVHLCLDRELRCQAVSQSYRLRAGQLLEAKLRFHFLNHISRKKPFNGNSAGRSGKIQKCNIKRQNQKETGEGQRLCGFLQLFSVPINSHINKKQWVKFLSV